MMRNPLNIFLKEKKYQITPITNIFLIIKLHQIPGILTNEFSISSLD